jgi:soluble lytic murein transglycosylase
MKTVLRAVIGIALALLPLSLPAADRTDADNAIIAAHRAFLAGDGARLVRIAEKTKGHILDVYVRFWMLSLRIEKADPEELRSFLDRNAGTVIANKLRRDWLHLLGERSEWEIFREQWPLLVDADWENRCYALEERMQRCGLDRTVAAGVESIWKIPRAMRKGCLPAVDAMVKAGLLKPQDVRDRLRLLISAGLITEARRTAERYPADGIPGPDRIKKVCRNPSAFLRQDDAIPGTGVGSELSFIALLLLAKRDLMGAADLLKGRLQGVIPLQDQRRLWSYFALQGARRHLPEALEWFRRGEKEAVSDDHLAWRVRLALRQEDWMEVKNAIESMSAPQRDESAWIYWLGRSFLAAGNRQEGKKLFEKISVRHNFYGLLAAEELGIPFRMPPKAPAPTKEELCRVSELSGIKRALALYRLDLPRVGAVEWRWCVRSMNDRQLLAASELARINGIWDRSITTADRTVAEHDFSLRYQMPYKELFVKHARNRHLDEVMVLGLVRQESLFNAAARSSAGAVGLMQLMPETARLTARKIGMNSFHKSRLVTPEVNTEIGTSHLRHLLDRFSLNYAVAAAAYNAGPRRAERWLNLKPLEGAIYVESIPFTETRRYVKKVMTNAVYYAAVNGGEPVSLKRILGTIGDDRSAEKEEEYSGFED